MTDAKPSACILRYSGYSLYEGEGGMPYVIRRVGNDQQMKEERINDLDALPNYVRFEIQAAWKQWFEWCRAMRGDE